MNAERRKFDRYPVSDQRYFVFNHESTEMAEIKNISKGGLRFGYFPVDPQKTPWKLIDLFSKKSKHAYILGIPCKLVYDIITLEEDYAFNGSPVRMAGLEFGFLSKEQNKKLDTLLNDLTQSLNI